MFASVDAAFGLLNCIYTGQPRATQRGKRVFFMTLGKEHAPCSLELEAVLEVVR